MKINISEDTPPLKKKTRSQNIWITSGYSDVSVDFLLLFSDFALATLLLSYSQIFYRRELADIDEVHSICNMPDSIRYFHHVYWQKHNNMCRTQWYPPPYVDLLIDLEQLQIWTTGILKKRALPATPQMNSNIQMSCVCFYCALVGCQAALRWPVNNSDWVAVPMFASAERRRVEVKGGQRGKAVTFHLRHQ